MSSDNRVERLDSVPQVNVVPIANAPNVRNAVAQVHLSYDQDLSESFGNGTSCSSAEMLPTQLNFMR